MTVFQTLLSKIACCLCGCTVDGFTYGPDSYLRVVGSMAYGPQAHASADYWESIGPFWTSNCPKPLTDAYVEYDVPFAGCGDIGEMEPATADRVYFDLPSMDSSPTPHRFHWDGEEWAVGNRVFYGDYGSSTRGSFCVSTVCNSGSCHDDTISEYVETHSTTSYTLTEVLACCFPNPTLSIFFTREISITVHDYECA